MIDFSDDFTSEPASGFATAAAATGSLAVSYNTTESAIDLTIGAYQSIWALTSLDTVPITDELIFEAELELVSDPVARKHLGIWLVQDGTLVQGYRIFHIDGTWSMTKWSSWTAETSIDVSTVSTPTFDVGERKTLKVIRAYSVFSVYVDDELVFTATDNTYESLRPGIFQYGCTNRVHAIRYQSAALELNILPLDAARFSWGNAETQDHAWPGENHCAGLTANPPELAAPITQLPHFTVPPSRAELGYIAGVVTVRQVVAPGRVVRCFNPSMQLVGETVTDEAGNYRFDNLLRNRLYLILAQDTWEFNYAPVGADRRTPEAYP